MALASSAVDITWRNTLAMVNIDINAAKKLGLTGVKKYLRCASQVEIELDWLHYWISELVTFIRHS